MRKILITGATGNVGIETIKAIHNFEFDEKVVAGVRNVEKDRTKLAGYDLDFVKFDFLDQTTYGEALAGCETLFLLRPPQLADVKKYFEPLIEQAIKSGVKHTVFLSVQGAPENRFIPHHKIEKLIVNSGMSYTFLRPAYFMQNFTTTLHKDLAEKRLIYLPADSTKFTLIDIRDVGAVAAQVLSNPERHVDQAYDLTSDETLNFRQMAEKLSDGLGFRINYESPTLWGFFWTKKQEGVATSFILVMIMLHYLPRFQKTPPLANWVRTITGFAPYSFEDFVRDFSTALSH